ncbi:MAG: (Proteasome assembly chaperone) family, partial [Pseudonocardiales bacterium]|nr:(Proteasome assembly chaperone) family [Pseudonocardiales bacterium]
AGDAATNAVEHLETIWGAQTLLEIDPDPYYDFQVNRPTDSLVDGITRRVTWPTTRLAVCRPPGAAFDVVLLRGIEPNMRWRSFCDEILDAVHGLNIATVITLGALLSDSPHTRPTPVSGTAYDAESAARYGLDTSRYEGPTGIVGVLQDACVAVGIPAISFWGAVPHYVAQPPNPKATLALLHRIEETLDLAVDLGELPQEAAEWQKLVDEMAAEDDEVTEYIHGLEQRDEEGELREASGDSIAREFERYLRRRDDGSSGFGGSSGPTARG